LFLLRRSRPCGTVPRAPEERQLSSTPPLPALSVGDYPRAGAGPLEQHQPAGIRVKKRAFKQPLISELWCSAVSG
jgi:hypothetical protein